MPGTEGNARTKNKPKQEGRKGREGTEKWGGKRGAIEKIAQRGMERGEEGKSEQWTRKNISS